MIAIAETPLFFPGAGYSLFGVFHEPVGSPTGEAFVFCHPFGEEKLWTHRVLVSFARLLAERGHAVLRFDYMGNGDSHGTFQASSLGTMISDVRAAVRQASSLAGTTRIRANSVNPGPTRTAMRRQAYPAEDAATLPEPAAILAPFLYLLGPASTGVNGLAFDSRPP